MVTDVRNWYTFAVSERIRMEDGRCGEEYEHYTDSSGKSGGQKEKLAYTILAASFVYSFGIIDFDDTNTCDVTVKDEAAFKEQISLVGFKSVNSYKEVLHKLGRTAYILTVNLN